MLNKGVGEVRALEEMSKVERVEEKVKERITFADILPDGRMRFKIAGENVFYNLDVREQPETLTVEFRGPFFSPKEFLKYKFKYPVPIYFRFKEEDLDRVRKFLDEELRGAVVSIVAGLIFGTDALGNFCFTLRGKKRDGMPGDHVSVSIFFDREKNKVKVACERYDVLSRKEEGVGNVKKIYKRMEIEAEIEWGEFE